MSCDKPSTTNGCTNVSPCGTTGCAEVVPAPTLPRCQDVALPAGVYPRATITVNAAGCISAIASGVAELYTPDECCPGTGGAGTGTAGPRGPQGDPGAAATISVDPVVAQGTTSGWTVVNNGTAAAAQFKFTSPAASTTGLFPAFGITGNVGGTATGLVVNQGLVTQLPSEIVTGIDLVKTGVRANDFIFTVAPTAPATPNRWTITLGIDQAFSSNDAALAALTARAGAVETTLNAAPTTAYLVASIAGTNVAAPTGVVYPAQKVSGFANTWQVNPSLAGQSLTTSAGNTVTIDATGRAQLGGGEYPTGVV